LVSGIIYVLYAIVLIEMLVQSTHIPLENGQTVNSSCFPSCWTNSAGGLFGLFLVAFSLFIAFISQLVQTFTFKAPFISELESTITKTNRRPIYYTMQVMGRLGFLGRALLFMLVAIVFTEILVGVPFEQDERLYTMAQALNVWASNTTGRVLLIIMGSLLIIYGIFAFLCIFFRRFPTFVTVNR